VISRSDFRKLDPLFGARVKLRRSAVSVSKKTSQKMTAEYNRALISHSHSTIIT